MGGLSATSQDDQPYLVYVDQEEVSARCGPGGQYYRTDPLRHGQALEVYIETPDGWLGIRPPDGSFCWLPADSVEREGSDQAVVIEDGALAWIGTHLGKARKYMWQVQLANGEQVAILGQAEREGPDGPQLWYRIVPPAGEFRWVHRDQVVDRPESLLRDKPSFAQQQRENTQAAEMARSVAPQVGEVESRPERSVLQPVAVAAPAPRAVLAEDESVTQHRESPILAISTTPVLQEIGSVAAERAPANSVGSDANWVAGGGRTTVTDAEGSIRRPISGDPATLARNDSPSVPGGAVVMASGHDANDIRSLDSLQLQLSRLMAGSADAIAVEPIRIAAATMAQTTASQRERERAILLAQRVQDYQAIVRRREIGSTPPGPRSEDGSGTWNASSTQMHAPAGSATQVGYLVQVFSARPDSPPFALTDTQGRTMLYVSPAPGVNLRRFLNQHISVSGQGGYLTGLDTPHLIATGAFRVAEQ